MILILKNKAISVAEVLHLRIFGHEMGGEMRSFLKNLSWSFFGGMIAAGIMFAVNILAGRFLGPLGYGEYNYIYSLAASLTFFFLLGNNQSSIRHIADEEYKNRRSKILSALLFLTIIQSIILFLVIFVFRSALSEKLNLSVNVIYFIVFMGFIFSFKELYDSFLRSFGLFKKQSLIKVIDAFFVLLFFIASIYILNGEIEYFHYAWAMIAGAIFSILAFLYLTGGQFSKFGKKEIFTIFNYNKFLIIGGFGGFVMSLEKVFIGKYMGIENLGIYSAYYASSQMIISNLNILFMNIFWPTVVKNKENISVILGKLETLFFKYSPLWIISNFVSISFILLLYGKQYPIYWLFILLFSISSLLNVFFSILMSIMNIDRVSQTIPINFIIYGVLISSVAIFKSISVYLMVQIIIYLIGIAYVRKSLTHNTVAKL